MILAWVLLILTIFRFSNTMMRSPCNAAGVRRLIVSSDEWLITQSDRITVHVSVEPIIDTEKQACLLTIKFTVFIFPCKILHGITV